MYLRFLSVVHSFLIMQAKCHPSHVVPSPCGAEERVLVY